MKTYKFLLAFCLVFSQVACVSSLTSVDSFSPSSSKILVVGKISLLPELESEFEQRTHWSAIGDSRILNKVFMATGGNPIHVDVDQIKFSDWQNMLETELGATFFIETEKKRTYFRGAMIMLDAMSQDRIMLPGNLYFNIPEGAQAVYIGTLRYSRDDFNNITDVQVINDYDSALKALTQKLGPGIELVPSLLKPIYDRPGQEA